MLVAVICIVDQLLIHIFADRSVNIIDSGIFDSSFLL